MWFLDGPEYFSPPGQPPRYLTYGNDVRQHVERLAEERHGGAMPLLYKQIVALSYQLAQFRCVAVLCCAPVPPRSPLAAGWWGRSLSAGAASHACSAWLSWVQLWAWPRPQTLPSQNAERHWRRRPC